MNNYFRVSRLVCLIEYSFLWSFPYTTKQQTYLAATKVTNRYLLKMNIGQNVTLAHFKFSLLIPADKSAEDTHLLFKLVNLVSLFSSVVLGE